MNALLCSVGLASVLMTQAADSIQIKPCPQRAGDVVKVRSINSFELAVKIDGEPGKEHDETRKSTEEMSYTETVLAVDIKGKPTKLRREYTQARMTFGEEQKTLPFEGKTVFIEKTGETWAFKIEGGAALKDDDADSLRFEFDSGDLTLDPDVIIRPRAPVKVGDTWRIDGQAIGRNYLATTPVPLDPTKATASGRLTKAYGKSGKQFAVFTVSANIPMKGDAKGEFKMSPESKMTLKQQVDGCADGTLRTETFSSDMQLSVKGEDGPAKITMQGTGVVRVVKEDVTRR